MAKAHGPYRGEELDQFVFLNPAPNVAEGSLGGKVSVSVPGTCLSSCPGLGLASALPAGWEERSSPTLCSQGAAMWGCAGTGTVTLTYNLCKLLAVQVASPLVCVCIVYKYIP